MHNDSLIVSLKTPKELPREIPAPPPPQPPRVPRSRQRGPSRMVMLFIVGLLLLGGGGWYVWSTVPLLWRDDPKESEEKETEAVAADDTNALIARVGRLIVLPQGEEPTIATVTDPEKLRDQVFFANAKVGHKVLIYTKARKAYLYDPTEDKLIEVAPLTVDAQ